VYHHTYDLPGWGQTGGEVRLRLDTLLMHRLAEFGARYGVPVLFHMEGEPEPTGQAIRLFDAHPETTFTQALRFYEERISALRQMLSQMTPGTARRIAHENAERLFAQRRAP